MQRHWVILRDGKPVATHDGDPFVWFLRHTPFSADWAMKHEGYSYEEDNYWLCATCHTLVPASLAGQVVVGGSTNPQTVYVHNTDGCRKAARPYPKGHRETRDRLIAELKA